MSFLEPDVVSTEICNFEIVVILNVFVNSPIGYVLLSLTFLLKIPFRAHSIIYTKPLSVNLCLPFTNNCINLISDLMNSYNFLKLTVHKK